MEPRRKLSLRFGASESWDPREMDAALESARLTEGRGADCVFIAASAPGIVEQAIRCSRPGAKILLFAQTSDKERIELSGKDICMGERTVFGSYSADVDLQRLSADLVFSGALPVERLVSHRVSLEDINRGFELALHPKAESLKIVVWPQGHPK
jgi:L-iditol 2-dehydrogenase